jgi:tetratricopeptide (TPR) repeat protein
MKFKYFVKTTTRVLGGLKIVIEWLIRNIQTIWGSKVFSFILKSFTNYNKIVITVISIGLTIVIIKDVLKERYEIESITFPDTGSNINYSESYLVSRLTIEVNKIIDRVQFDTTIFTYGEYPAFNTSEVNKLEIPDAKLSSGTISKFIKGILNKNSKIQGYLYYQNDSLCFEWHVKRRGDGRVVNNRVFVSSQMGDKTITEISLCLLEILDPVLSASYYTFYDPEKAIKIIKREISEAKDDDISVELIDIGNALSRSGKYFEAIEKYREAIIITNEKGIKSIGYSNLAVSMENINGDTVDILKYYQRAIDIDDKMPTGFYFKGNYYLRYGNYSTARHFLDEAEKRCEKLPSLKSSIFIELIRANIFLGDTVAALSNYNKAYHSGVKNANLYYEWGCLEDALGNKREALKKYLMTAELSKLDELTQKANARANKIIEIMKKDL